MVQIYQQTQQRLERCYHLRKRIFSTATCSDEKLYQSTVMLAVDISFLAVPGVVTGAAVCVSLSAMCSVSSLVVSMVLGGESRGWGTDSAEGAVSHTTNAYECGAYIFIIKASFMARKVGAQRDIEALAIMYSLPYAFLIWG